MEELENDSQSNYREFKKRTKRDKWYTRDPKRERRKKTLFGLSVVTFGVWWLLRRMDIEIAPDWVFTWPSLIIAIGIFNIIGNGLRSATGYIMVLIGSFFLARNVFDIPLSIEPYFWPAIVIGIGLIILFKPKKRWDPEKKNCNTDDRNQTQEQLNESDRVDSLVVFGGVNRDVISKSFKGGELTACMGGAEFNFGKADIETSATLDVTIIMGGVKLIVPQNWDVQINCTNILGGVDDKRRGNGAPIETSKKLILTGTVIMGGVEIKSI